MAMCQLFWGVSCYALKGSGLRPKGSLAALEGSFNSPSFRFDEGARAETKLALVMPSEEEKEA